MFNLQVANKDYTVKFSHDHVEEKGKLLCANTWALFFIGNYLLDWQEIRCINGDNLDKDKRRKNAMARILCRQFSDRSVRKMFWDAYFLKQKSYHLNTNRFNLRNFLGGLFKN